jgi:hypothetical protein
MKKMAKFTDSNLPQGETPWDVPNKWTVCPIATVAQWFGE